MEIYWPSNPTKEDFELASRYGYTPQLISRFRRVVKDLEAFLEAMENYDRKFIRVNTLKTSKESLRSSLEDKGFVLKETPIEEFFEVKREPFSITSTPEYLRGEFYVQDLSSAIPPLILDPKPRELILDLGAAPGGKSSYLAQLSRDEADIVAVDISKERMRAMRSNLNRLGITSVICVRKDGRRVHELGLEFDKVLLDAPCTGEGVIPRDPSRKKARKAEYETRISIQIDLISAAMKVLKPGGILVYSTCTYSIEENEGVIEYAVENLGAEIVEIKFNKIALSEGIGLKGVKRAFPHIQGILGAFYAKLKKKMEEDRRKRVRGYKKKALQVRSLHRGSHT